MRPIAIAIVLLAVSAGMLRAQTAPFPSPATPGTAAPAPATEPQPPAGKTLVPVVDPRCSLVMPPVQTYREVSVEEAKAPPNCAPSPAPP